MREKMREIARFDIESSIPLYEFRHAMSEAYALEAANQFRTISKEGKVLQTHRNTLHRYGARRKRTA